MHTSFSFVWVNQHSFLKLTGFWPVFLLVVGRLGCNMAATDLASAFLRINLVNNILVLVRQDNKYCSRPLYSLILYFCLPVFFFVFFFSCCTLLVIAAVFVTPRYVIDSWFQFFIFLICLVYEVFAISCVFILCPPISLI